MKKLTLVQSNECQTIKGRDFLKSISEMEKLEPQFIIRKELKEEVNLLEKELWELQDSLFEMEEIENPTNCDEQYINDLTIEIEELEDKLNYFYNQLEEIRTFNNTPKIETLFSKMPVEIYKDGILTKESKKAIKSSFFNLIELRDEWEHIWHRATDPIEKSRANIEFRKCLQLQTFFQNTYGLNILFN